MTNDILLFHKLLRSRAGGKLLIIDMNRASVFDINPHLKERVADGINRDGSNLGTITASFQWEDVEKPRYICVDMLLICKTFKYVK